MKLGETKVWSIVLKGAEFKEIRELVHTLLSRIYGEQFPERVVSSTVFTPLQDVTGESLLKVWVIPRTGQKVIIKLTYTEWIDDFTNDRHHAKAFEKIKLDLLDLLKLGFRHLIEAK